MRIAPRAAAARAGVRLRLTLLFGALFLVSGAALLGPGQAILTVENTGPDVPPGDIPRLLQPFQRRAAGRAGPRGGLGLGLSIAQAIATAHGARLTLTPRPGGGLTAELAFPAPLAPSPPVADHPESPSLVLAGNLPGTL